MTGAPGEPVTRFLAPDDPGGGLPDPLPPGVAFEDIVLGGHEIAAGDLSRSAGELARHGILSPELVAAASGEAAGTSRSCAPLTEATENGILLMRSSRPIGSRFGK